MACIIYVSLYIYIWSIWPQLVVEHNWRSNWRRPLREPRDAPLESGCGETTELEGRGPSINISPHLSRHPNGIREAERFLLEERRKKVRRYNTTQPWESAQLPRSTKSRKERVKTTVGRDRVCTFVVWQDEMKMRWCLSTPGRSFHLRDPCISLHPSSLLNHALGGRDRASSKLHLEVRIDWTQRDTLRPWASQFGDAIGDRD